MKKKRALVTGGAGFLGSHLCERLLAQNWDVLCVDNFYTGTQNNLCNLLSHPNFTFLEYDVCDPLSVEVEAIYHLACPASPIHYQRDPIKTTKTSVLGALHLLELARHLNVPILYTSTSEIYGDPTQHPQKETYWGHVNSIGPRACYDEGKRCAESLFMDYYRQYQIDIRIARIFNTYGPKMSANDGRIISNFIVQALNNEALTVYGEGHQTRSFCYVDDTISGLIKLMECPKIHLPVNIGNPVEKNVLEIAETIIRLTNSNSTITTLPLPVDDPKQRCPDITRAKTLLQWEPKVDLMTGLKQTIHYFQNQLINIESFDLK